MVININIAGRVATTEGAPVIICGNTDYSIEFTFDTEWTGVDARTARFTYVQDGVTKHVDVDFYGTNCPVPSLSDTKQVKVGVYTEDSWTTTPAVIPCLYSIKCGSGEAVTPIVVAPDIEICRAVISHTSDVTALYVSYETAAGGRTTTRGNVNISTLVVGSYLFIRPVDGATVTVMIETGVTPVTDISSSYCLVYEVTAEPGEQVTLMISG